MDYTLRPITDQERLYAYTQSFQIGSQTGNIGHLCADMGSNGEGFFSTWWDCRSDLKTKEFKEEFNDLISSLREKGQPFYNRTAVLDKPIQEKPSTESHEVLKNLRQTNDNMNRIAAKANSMNFIDTAKYWANVSELQRCIGKLMEEMFIRKKYLRHLKNMI